MRLHHEPRKAPKHNTINVCTKLETCKLHAKASPESVSPPTTEQVRPASLSQPHPTRARHSQPDPARASQPDTRPNIRPASQPASQPEPAGQPANQPTAGVSRSQPASQPVSQSQPTGVSLPGRQTASQPAGWGFPRDFLREFPWEFLQFRPGISAGISWGIFLGKNPGPNCL